MRLERRPSNRPGSVDFHDSLLDTHRKQVQCPRGRRAKNIAMDVECRGVAGAGKPLFIWNPRYCTTEMGAFSVQGQKTTILQACQIKLARAKRRNTARLESLDRTGNVNISPFSRRRPGAA